MELAGDQNDRISCEYTSESSHTVLRMGSKNWKTKEELRGKSQVNDGIEEEDGKGMRMW